MPEPCLLRSPLLAEHGIHGIFSLRTGGVSQAPFDSLNLADDTGDKAESVARNLHILLHHAGLETTPHRARQVHGTATLMCQGNGRQHQEEADILLCRDGSPLAVRVADCVPLLLADATDGIFCAVHAGWRGTAAGVVTKAIEQMLANGAKRKNLLAAIGPCIGPCCFEIGADTAEQLAACCPGAESFIQSRDGCLYADLSALNRLHLLQAGIAEGHIETADALMPSSTPACTCCNAEHFFSYRRDGKASGRHLAIVAPVMPA